MEEGNLSYRDDALKWRAQSMQIWAHSSSPVMWNTPTIEIIRPPQEKVDDEICISLTISQQRNKSETLFYMAVKTLQLNSILCGVLNF